MIPQKIIPSKELKNKIGSVFSFASHEPVAITRNGHFSFVLLSAQDWMKREENINAPMRDTSKSWKSTSAFGIWADNERVDHPDTFVRDLRKPRFLEI